MIGCFEEAELILKKCLEEMEDCCLPDGWEIVGHGGSRVAFLSPTGIVYKISEYPENNLKEFQKIEELAGKEIDSGWRIPKASIYEIDGEYVLAMEYIKGKFDFDCWEVCKCGEVICRADQRAEFGTKYGIFDLTFERNVLVEEDGIRVPVDLAW